MPTSASHLVTVDDLLRRPEDKFEELIEGGLHLHRKEPRRAGPALVGSRLSRALVHYELDHPRICGVLPAGTGYIVGRDPDSVLAPSLGIVAKAVVEAMSIHGEGYIDGAPIIAIENQEYSDDEALIARKAGLHLAGGAREFWWVRSMASTVTVYRSNADPCVLTVGGTLTSNALPGFRLELSDLFA